MLSHSAVLQAECGCDKQLGGVLQTLQIPVQGMAGCLGIEVRQLPERVWLLESHWQSATAMQAFFAAPLLQQVFDHALQHGLLRSLQNRTVDVCAIC